MNDSIDSKRHLYEFCRFYRLSRLNQQKRHAGCGIFQSTELKNNAVLSIDLLQQLTSITPRPHINKQIEKISLKNSQETFSRNLFDPTVGIATASLF